MFSIAGHYVGEGMVVNNGVKVIKPIILIVLFLLLIKSSVGNIEKIGKKQSGGYTSTLFLY